MKNIILSALASLRRFLPGRKIEPVASVETAYPVPSPASQTIRRPVTAQPVRFVTVSKRQNLSRYARANGYRLRLRHTRSRTQSLLVNVEGGRNEA